MAWILNAAEKAAILEANLLATHRSAAEPKLKTIVGPAGRKDPIT